MSEFPNFYQDLDSTDYKERLREFHTLQAVELRLKSELLKVRQAQYSAGSGFTPVNDPEGKSAVEQFQHANEDYIELGRRMLPYMDWPDREPEGDTLDVNDSEAMKAAWEQEFGVRVDSPEFQEQLERMRVPEPPGTQ